MELLEQNLGTMERLAKSLQQREGTLSQFDGLIYELIEEGIFEAEAGNFARDIWDGKEVAECESCEEFWAELSTDENSGLKMCHRCLEEDAN